jgi:hypothetical protein
MSLQDWLLAGFAGSALAKPASNLSHNDQSIDQSIGLYEV